jgi:hypothetical protein
MDIQNKKQGLTSLRTRDIIEIGLVTIITACLIARILQLV